MRAKSRTDEYWNSRALTEADDAKVNMPDTVQRDFELQFVFQHLPAASRILEVGCGNGFVTQQIRERVVHVNAIDYSENMIARAISTYRQTNNRFLRDDVLDPQNVTGPYDAIVCIRVLMNLRSWDEQVRAIVNMAKLLRHGGRLILIDGFRDGFESLNEIRARIGLPPITPATHNFHTDVSSIVDVITRYFTIEDTWHTGVYDFLTRVVFPQLVGAENATAPGEFHLKIEHIIRTHAMLERRDFERSPKASIPMRPALEQYGRVRGFALTRRPTDNG